MKTAEPKIAPSQQHKTATNSFFDRGQESTFFADRSVDRSSFFPATDPKSIQAKSLPGHKPFFAHSPTPTIQAKCDTCVAQEKSESESKEAESPQIQMMPAFESAADGEDPGTVQPFVQFSLKVGQPGDAYEREADAMADRVVSTPRETTSDLAPKNVSKSQPQQINRQQPAGMRSLMRQATDSKPASAPKNLESRLQQTRGGGSPLDANTRSAMERAFNNDFSGVQIHTGQESANLNKSLGARAFTHGNDIFFNSGEYQPQSSQGKHLLAHELTHTIQQGGAIQRKAETPPVAAVGKQSISSSEVVDVSTDIFNPSEKVKAEIEEQGDKGLDVRIIIKGLTSEGHVKIKLDKQGYDSIGKGSMRLLNDWTDKLGGMYINFTVKNNQIAGGFAALTPGGGDPNDWLQTLREKSAILGGLGLKIERLPTPINQFENGKLTLGVTNLNVEIGGYVDAKFDLSLENTKKPKIDATATINVKGIAEGTLALDNTQDKLAGKVSLAINFKSFNGKATVQYNPDGTVDIGGRAAYNANKLSGEVEFVSTDLAAANKFAQDAIAAAGGTNNVQNAPPPAPVPSPKGKKRSLAATGQLAFNLTTWFAGTVNVVVDGEGHITVIGKIAPPGEIELFKQRDWDKELFKVEVKAYYGLPVVGNLNLFANISLHALAKLGPAKLYNIEVLGTYSTDPTIQKSIQISGSLNISAYAGLSLRAEGGAGVEILDHDLKFGIGLNADLGIKAYADARPTIGYRDPGEFYVSGTLEMVAQPMLALGGNFFIELKAPWWSPVSNEKWIWPLFSKEWPLSDPIGISASLKDYVLGSGKIPDVEMKKPEFDSSKFMTNMVDNKLPEKSGGQPTGQSTFTGDGSVPPPTVPPTKAKPSSPSSPAKPGQKKAPSATGKSAAPNPNAVAAQNTTKLFRDVSKPLAALKSKAPFTLIDLNKELAKIKGQVGGIDFDVQLKGELFVVTPKAGGKTSKPIELGAKDTKQSGKKGTGGKYDGQLGKVINFTAAQESHRLWIIQQGNNAVVMMASVEKPVTEQLNDYQKTVQELQDKEKQAKVTTLISQARGILTGLDTNADKLARDAAKPEAKPEEIAAEDAAVESSEDQLVSTIKKIRQELGLKNDVKASIAKELKGKTIKDFSQEEALLNSIYQKYTPEGLKSLKFVKRPKEIGVLVSASLEEEVAKLDLRQPENWERLFEIMQKVKYLVKGSTWIFAYYNGEKIAEVKNKPGSHAEAVFINKYLTELRERMVDEVNNGILKKDGSVNIHWDMSRTPCGGCSESHIDYMLSELKKDPSLANIKIKLTIKASAVEGSTGIEGLRKLLNPERLDKIEIEGTDIWDVISDKMASNAAYYETDTGIVDYVSLNFGDFRSKALKLKETIDEVVAEHKNRPKDMSK
jgi:Domain of unknown function (DUF4157)